MLREINGIGFCILLMFGFYERKGKNVMQLLGFG